jgi:hypothetical protein
MNVRSFASLDEILISSQSYDEDLFEVDTSTRENPQRFDIDINPIPKSPLAPDYTNDLFESDDHLLALKSDDCDAEDDSFYEQATNSFIEEENINQAVEDDECSRPFEVTSTSAGRLRPSSETLGFSVDSVNLVAQIDQSPILSPHPKYSTKLRKSEFNQSNHVVVINHNSAVGLNLVKNQFSRVKKVSEKDFEMLVQLKRRSKQTNAPRQRNDAQYVRRMDGSLCHPLPVAVSQIEERSKAVSLVASRAIHVANADYGIDKKTADRVMCNADRLRVYGIPDYDPDYDCACEMKDQNVTPSLPRELLLQRSENVYLSQDRDQESKGLSRASSARSNYSPSNEVLSRSLNSEIPKRTYDDSAHSAEEKAIKAAKCATEGMPFYQSEYSGKDSVGVSSIRSNTAAIRRPVAYRGAADMVLDDIREGRVTSNLLRIGVDRDMLKSKSEEIHSSFLADLLGEGLQHHFMNPNKVSTSSEESCLLAPVM